MGGYVSSVGDKFSDAAEERVTTIQRDMMKRQFEVQNMMRETQMSIQIARARDTFHWFSAFYVTLGTIATARYLKTSSPAMFAPLLPLTFVCGFQFDMAYGNKMLRIQSDAERILESERDTLLKRPVHPNEMEILPFLDQEREPTGWPAPFFSQWIIEQQAQFRKNRARYLDSDSKVKTWSTVSESEILKEIPEDDDDYIDDELLDELEESYDDDDEEEDFE